ncbi:hypothetical protein [Lichenicoccus sp.]|uniref:hypothetical protein n=1 Tax=Lichenicoccus sp. TaxID=2781899 RepID=UPI003D150DD6
MQRPLPTVAEPVLEQSGTPSALRGFCYAGLVLLLAAGGWMRFSDGIMSLVPGTNTQAAGLPIGAPTALRGLVELAMVPSGEASAAIQAMKLPAGDAAALQQAVSRREVRLVRMPIYENDGAAGRIVQVSTAGFSRTVALSPTPTVLTLPIAHAGTVSFRALGTAAEASVAIGALTLSGPVALPPLPIGQVLEVGVLAQ